MVYIRLISLFFLRKNVSPGSCDCAGKGKLLY